jgi:glycosyltransferase involved in cell wall biosynthesis
VEDIRPFLDRATVFVCPMRMGAGIKNKILQAWAMEKPVVATSTAIGGLRASPGENIVVATGPKAFAGAVVALLRDPSARQHLGKHGRDTVLTFYSWEQQARTFEHVLGSA